MDKYNHPIPHYAQLAWRMNDLDGNSRRTNILTVINAAISIAEKDGLPNLTIRRLSKELSLTTMAIYRHVNSRDELLILMVDTALGAPVIRISEDSWQVALKKWGMGLYERYSNASWMLDAPSLGKPTTPHHIAWVESGLETLKDSRLTTQQRLDILLLVDGHVRNIANIQYPRYTPQNKDTSWLSTVMPKEEYPVLFDIIQEDTLRDAKGPDVEFGLDCIINGIAQ